MRTILPNKKWNVFLTEQRFLHISFHFEMTKQVGGMSKNWFCALLLKVIAYKNIYCKSEKRVSYFKLTTWNQEVLAHLKRTTNNGINDMFDFSKKNGHLMLHSGSKSTVKMSANAECHTSTCDEDQCSEENIFLVAEVSSWSWFMRPDLVWKRLPAKGMNLKFLVLFMVGKIFRRHFHFKQISY